MNEMLSRRVALRAATLSALGAGLAVAGARPVAAETPAEEAVRLLARVESLLDNEMRWDEESRVPIADLADYLRWLCDAWDSQDAHR